MDAAAVIGIIGTLIGIAGGIFGISANIRNKDRTISKDGEQDGREIGKILADIGYVKTSVDDIKTKLDKQDQRYTDIVAKLTLLESFKGLCENTFNTHEDRFRQLEQEIHSLRQFHLHE